MGKHTLIFCATDTTSVQVVTVTGDLQKAIESIQTDDESAWLRDMVLIAAIEGSHRVKVKDDNKWISEHALQ